jgi:DNA-binding transcriptional ArsR family regulator
MDNTQAAILRALPGPTGDQWSTARAVAEATGTGYSTVTEHLRAMVEAGVAATVKQGRSNMFRKNGAAPKLGRKDVVTPRAKPAPPRKVGTGRVLAESGDTPAGGAASTVCGRSMRTGFEVARAEKPEGAKPCPQCRDGMTFVCDTVWVAAKRRGVTYHEPRPAESAAPAPEPAPVPQPPAAANTPGAIDLMAALRASVERAKDARDTGSVGEAIGFLESVRPVSAAPAEPERKPRTPRVPKGDRAPFAVWGRGELQTAILDHLRGLADDADVTPTQVARVLNSHAGAVAYGLDRLTTKGEAKKTSDKPMKYAAA